MEKHMYADSCHTLTSLAPAEFRDALSLNYHRPILKTPAYCYGCGDNHRPMHI